MVGKWQPYLAVLVIQGIYAGMFLFSKAAFDNGINSFVFVFYRQALAALFLAPFAVFLEWRNAPPLSFLTLCKIFLLSLCGMTAALDVNGLAIAYTSATLAAAIVNSLPAITFFLAVLLRVEGLMLRRETGVAKVGGVVICLAGVAVLAFFKGPQWRILHRHRRTALAASASGDAGSSWIQGCFLMLTSNVLWALWMVLQGAVLKSYDSKLLFTMLQCLFSSLQSFAIAIAVERDLHQWRLGWDLPLMAIAYCGIVVTGVTYYLQTWVIEKKGPVFMAMSTPLSLVITLFFSALVLGYSVALGSILGGMLLVGGLSTVVWGKHREEKEGESDEQNKPSV